MRMRQQQAEKSAERRKCHHGQNQKDPFPRIECRIENERHQQQRDRHNKRQPTVSALLALVFARPVQVIALGKLHLLADFFDGLPYRAAQVASAHAVLNRDIARVAFAVNRRRAIIQRNVAHLAQGHALARRRKNSDAANILHRRPELRLIADGQVIALLADQDLAHRLSTHRSFHRVLNVAHVDSEAIRRRAIHHQIHVRLSAHLKCSEIRHARNLAHHFLHLLGFLLKRLQVASKKLDRQLAFHSADCLLHVVGNRLRKIPVHAGKFIERFIHRRNQLILRVILLPPFFPRQQVDEELRVIETAGIAAVIRTPHLTHHLRHFRKSRQHQPSLVR